jgi:hypothetical protein
MQWGRTSRAPDAAQYLREIELFLTARQDRRPAVLWPQYEPPGLDGPGFDDHIDRLADELTVRLGRTTVPVHPVTAADGTTLRSPEAGAEALLVQGPGAVGVTVSSAGTPPGEPAWCQQIRLRTGEVLYLPVDAAYTVTGEAGTRYGLLSIATATV